MKCGTLIILLFTYGSQHAAVNLRTVRLNCLLTKVCWLSGHSAVRAWGRYPWQRRHQAPSRAEDRGKVTLITRRQSDRGDAKL